MDILSLNVAILLALTGLLLNLVLLKLIFSSIFGDGTGWLERIKIKQKEALAARADILIKNADLQAATMLLRDSFIFDHIKADIRLIERVYTHHLAVLGRLIGLGDKFSIHLDTLPVIEDLLQSRAQLMKSFLEKRLARDAVRQRKGKVSPGAAHWAIPEFNRQIEEIADKIITNRRSLESQISLLFSALNRAKHTEGVTYH